MNAIIRLQFLKGAAESLEVRPGTTKQVVFCQVMQRGRERGEEPSVDDEEVSCRRLRGHQRDTVAKVRSCVDKQSLYFGSDPKQ